jgi:hypothetical protein
MIEVLVEAGQIYPQPYNVSTNSCATTTMLVLKNAGYDATSVGRSVKFPSRRS